MSQLSIGQHFPTIAQALLDIPDDLGIAATAVGADAIDIPRQVRGLFAPDAMSPPYRRWLMRVKYKWFEGLGFMPTSPPIGGSAPQNKVGVYPLPGDTQRQKAAIPRLTSPYGFMAIYWTAVREGKEPTKPTPVLGNPNFVLAEAEFEGGPPDVSENSVRVYRESGVYLYYALQPPWVLDGLNVGATPIHTLQPSDNIPAASQFTKAF